MPFSLKLTWEDGRANVVDLAEVIYRYAVFAPLRENPTLFRAVKMIDRGFGIGWTKEMDSAQSLRRIASSR